VIGTPVAAPSQARPATAAERRARPWSLPFTVAGARPFVWRSLLPAARRAGLD
jgi:hypothetical protein